MIVISPGKLIQSIINENIDEIEFRLLPGTYEGSFELNRSLTLRSINDNRPVIISRATDTIKITGPYVSLSLLEVRNMNPNGTIIHQIQTGYRAKLTHCSIFGDETNGQHRGIHADGEGMHIQLCNVDNCWAVGRDAQAVYGQDGTKNLLIEDSYLGGGAQSVMMGGGDPSNEDSIPTNISLRRCRLGKNLALWKSKNAQLKCALELKNCRNFSMIDCDISGAGISQGQGAYLIVLTPRNQGGRAPYSTVQNVLIQNCIGQNAAGLVNMLGSDDVNPSGPLRNVVFKNMTVSDLNGFRFNTQGRIFQFNRGPQNISFENIDVDGMNLGASGYFIGTPPLGLVMRDIHTPTTKYGWKIDNGGSGLDALRKYCPMGIFEGVI